MDFCGIEHNSTIEGGKKNTHNGMKKWEARLVLISSLEWHTVTHLLDMICISPDIFQRDCEGAGEIQLSLWCNECERGGLFTPWWPIYSTCGIALFGLLSLFLLKGGFQKWTQYVSQRNSFKKKQKQRKKKNIRSIHHSIIAGNPFPGHHSFQEIFKMLLPNFLVFLLADFKIL